MVFDPKEKFYFQDPGRIGQAVSDDEDDTLYDDPGIGDDSDAEPDDVQAADSGSGIRDLVDTSQDFQDKYQELRDRIKRGQGNTIVAQKESGPKVYDKGRVRTTMDSKTRVYKPGEGWVEASQSGPKDTGFTRTSMDGKNRIYKPGEGWVEPAKRGPKTLWEQAQEGRRASKAAAERAAKKGVQQAGKAGAQAAGKAAAGGAARAAASTGGLAIAEAIGAATGPAGWIFDAVVIGAQAAYAFSKTKVFRWSLAGISFVLACFMLLMAAGNKAILQSGLNGASEVIRTFVTNAFLPITAAQSVITFVQNIDKITADINQLIKENPALTSKAAEVDALLGQLVALRNDIEPTAGSGGQATAEQLQKYNDVILQLKKIFEGDREGTAALVLAANEGGSLRLSETGCNALKDIKNLSVTTKTMKVILAAAEYGKSTGKTIRVTCLVSGHRKYVGKPPSEGYPYCGQPDNALSAGFSASRMSLHCAGRGIDFGGIDTAFGTYLNTHREELNIEDILIERDTNHIHVEVKP